MSKNVFFLLVAGVFLSFIAITAKSNNSDLEETPVVHDQIYEDLSWSGTRAWRPVDLSGQDGALGYNKNTFNVPPGLERQVQFWIDIYTKYTTSQGVLHDAEEIDFIYSVMDFSDIDKLQTLNARTREKLKQKAVDEEKKKILNRLERVMAAKSEKDVDRQDREMFKVRDSLNPQRLRFQLGQKDRMQKAIFISGRYLEDFERIFRENNLPIELTRLVFVESSFNVLARSKVGASGLWQIMPSTARPFRMMTSTSDRRNHPLDATKLAARVLRMNHDLLNSWPLAITGYNHGPTGVLKMTQKYKTRDVADLVQNARSRKSFGFASRNFYASFLAALEVEKKASKYFPNVLWSQKLPGEPLKLPVSVKYSELVSWFSGDDIKAQVFNPHFTRAVMAGHHAIPARSWIQVPRHQFPKVLAKLAKKKREEISSSRRTASAK